jgi:hypothetical protein
MIMVVPFETLIKCEMFLNDCSAADDGVQQCNHPVVRRDVIGVSNGVLGIYVCEVFDHPEIGVFGVSRILKNTV